MTTRNSSCTLLHTLIVAARALACVRNQGICALAFAKRVGHVGHNLIRDRDAGLVRGGRRKLALQLPRQLLEGDGLSAHVSPVASEQQTQGQLSARTFLMQARITKDSRGRARCNKELRLDPEHHATFEACWHPECRGRIGRVFISPSLMLQFVGKSFVLEKFSSSYAKLSKCRFGQHERCHIVQTVLRVKICGCRRKGLGYILELEDFA